MVRGVEVAPLTVIEKGGCAVIHRRNQRDEIPDLVLSEWAVSSCRPVEAEKAGKRLIDQKVTVAFESRESPSLDPNSDSV